MTPYHRSDAVTIYHGDCRDVLPTLEPVDAIVCDPPYGLTQNKKGGSGAASVNLASPYGRARVTTGNGPGGFMGMAWDHGVPGVEFWAAALAAAKPGAHLLAFGGTRTHHRLMVAIEDAGWELRDVVMWVYGSGFPKSLDVGKVIDKVAGAERASTGRKAVGRGNRRGNGFQHAGDADGLPVTVPATDAAREWDGWGTALKPAWEPIIVARKPLVGTVAANVLEHGTGALNIDACRVETGDDLNGGAYVEQGSRVDLPGASRSDAAAGMMAPGKTVGRTFEQPEGRWPANLIHDGSDEVLAEFPEQMSGANPTRRHSNVFGTVYGRFEGQREIIPLRGANSGSAARFFYCAKASRAERNAGLDGPERPLLWSSGEQSPGTFQSEGTHKAARNDHPTVKPVALMRYLCRLVTPPGGTVLDPFMGSGSTGVAARREGFRFVGVDTEARYCEIAANRMAQGVLALVGATKGSRT